MYKYNCSIHIEYYNLNSDTDLNLVLKKKHERSATELSIAILAVFLPIFNTSFLCLKIKLNFTFCYFLEWCMESRDQVSDSTTTKTEESNIFLEKIYAKATLRQPQNFSKKETWRC